MRFDLDDFLIELEARLARARSGIDYNELSFEEKQAAYALVEEGKAKFGEEDGRTVVLRHTPSLIRRFVTMGAYA